MDSVNARFFALAPFLLGIKPEYHCQAVLDIMPGPSRKNSWWNQRRDLHTLVVKFKYSEASDPRDKIFALLGIASDGKRLLPDYTKRQRQVVDETSNLLFGFPSSRVLSARTIPRFLSNFDRFNQTQFENITATFDVSKVADFYERRREFVRITEQVMLSAARNLKGGEKVMDFLANMEKRFKLPGAQHTRQSPMRRAGEN